MDEKNVLSDGAKWTLYPCLESCLQQAPLMFSPRFTSKHHIALSAQTNGWSDHHPSHRVGDPWSLEPPKKNILDETIWKWIPCRPLLCDGYESHSQLKDQLASIPRTFCPLQQGTHLEHPFLPQDVFDLCRWKTVSEEHKSISNGTLGFKVLIWIIKYNISLTSIKAIWGFSLIKHDSRVRSS